MKANEEVMQRLQNSFRLLQNDLFPMLRGGLITKVYDFELILRPPHSQTTAVFDVCPNCLKVFELLTFYNRIRA